MGLFGKLSEQIEENKKIQAEAFANEFIKRYNLDDMELEDRDVLFKIVDSLKRNDFFTMGRIDSFDGKDNRAKITYLSALVEQNWMIMGQLSKLNKKLEKQKSSVSAADEIKKLRDLLYEGTITDGEFNAKKKELLGI